MACTMDDSIRLLEADIGDGAQVVHYKADGSLIALKVKPAKADL